MTDHIIIDTVTHVYECLNCGFKSEPPWMIPPADIALEAVDFFLAEHNDCQKSVGATLDEEQSQTASD